MKIKDVIKTAKDQLSTVTGLKSLSVTKVKKEKQSWQIEVELLEMSRIPPATDVIGDYDVALDSEGNMTSFERKRTRLRGEPVGATE